MLAKARPEVWKRQEFSAQLEETFLDPQLTPCSCAQRDEVRSLLQDALYRLEDREREPIILRFVKDKTLDQCAESLGISRDTVMERIWHGLGELRLWLGEPFPAMCRHLQTMELCEHEMYRAWVGAGTAPGPVASLQAVLVNV